MSWPWKKIIEVGRAIAEAVKPAIWPPKFCFRCDGRMEQLNGDPDIYVCTGGRFSKYLLNAADDISKGKGGCGLWLRRPGTGKQQGELPNQGEHRGEL